MVLLVGSSAGTAGRCVIDWLQVGGGWWVVHSTEKFQRHHQPLVGERDSTTVCHSELDLLSSPRPVWSFSCSIVVSFLNFPQTKCLPHSEQLRLSCALRAMASNPAMLAPSRRLSRDRVLRLL